MDVDVSTLSEEDLYTKLKNLQRQLDFLAIQEDYVKDEHKNLKRELLRAQEEVKRIQSVPLVGHRNSCPFYIPATFLLTRFPRRTGYWTVFGND